MNDDLSSQDEEELEVTSSSSSHQPHQHWSMDTQETNNTSSSAEEEEDAEESVEEASLLFRRHQQQQQQPSNLSDNSNRTRFNSNTHHHHHPHHQHHHSNCGSSGGRRRGEDEENIFLFVPNLIGYARVVLGLASCITMPTHPLATLLLYFLSAFLDAFDGMAARRWNQSTKFGAMLDQLTDRCGTLCLIFALGTLYPRYLFLLQLSAVIDIASHWIHTQVSLMSGRTSHKTIDLKSNPLLYLYYSNRTVLFTMCALNEVFYVSLYLYHFFPGPFLYTTTSVTFVFALAKTFVSLIQLTAACYNCGQIDVQERARAKQSIRNSNVQSQMAQLEFEGEQIRALIVGRERVMPIRSRARFQ